MSIEPRNSASNARGRPFEPGNPGKPKGVRNRATQVVEALMQGEVAAITRAVVEAAKGGDMVAARLILERLAPVRKGRPVQIELPPARDAVGVHAALATVTEAVGRGELTPEEGQAMAGLLETQRRSIETLDLERRIMALEQQQ